MNEVSGANGAKSLAGRTAIVSGGARGIGEAVVRGLVDCGAKVVIADLLDDLGEDLARALGPSTRFEHLDVTDEDAWRRSAAAALDWGGTLDILVNCAGIASFETLLDFELAHFDRVLQVNLVGTFLGIKHVTPGMAAGGRGSIVNISSTAGLEGGNSLGAYAASKWGVRGLTKVAAMELGPRGIRVNSVHPGPMNTMMFNPQGRPAEDFRDYPMLRRMPLARVAEPSEIANVCVFLAGDGASFMTGAEVAVDGGATVGMYYPHRAGAPAG